jgi:predicted Zn-dependent protease
MCVRLRIHHRQGYPWAHTPHRALHAATPRSAIRNDPSKLVLQHTLARLLLRLGQVRPATALLDRCMEAHRARADGSAGSDLDALAQDVDT